MTTIRYFDTETGPTEFSIASFESSKGRLIGDDTYRIRSEAGETLIFHGNFDTNADTGGKFVLQLNDAVFRNADGDKIASIDDFHWDDLSGQSPVRLQDARNLALSFIDNYIGTIGDDHILTWGGLGASRVYGLAGNDVVSVSSEAFSALGYIYDGGLGRDTLNFSKVNISGDSGTNPETPGVGLSVEDGSVGLGSSSASMIHFERYVGTRYFDTFEGSDRAETFDGRGGIDYIAGGGGADRFVFGIGYNNDFIQDFEVGKDKIVIRDDLGFSNFKQLEDFTTVQDNTATIDFGADDVLQITIKNGQHLSASDFIFH